ncbi:MAG: insulinase family protein [Candidatus Eisenbacteria bacterium]|nr:insulinase family protein [Candidatus Eisenbacteria bacterium]
MRRDAAIVAAAGNAVRGFVVATALVAAACAVHAAAAPAAPAGRTTPIPAPQIRTLGNGLTVAVFPDARLPIVQIQLLVPAGSMDEAPGQSGLASLTARMLSQGTTSRTAATYATAVEALGGSVGGSASREYTVVNGAFMASDFEAGLELLTDAVVHPVFDEDQLRAVKEQMTSSLAASHRSPAAVGDELLWAGAFAGHPYARSPVGSARAIPALTLSQVRAFHRERYRPDRALLAIAGDVIPDRAFQTATELLGDWGGRAPSAPPPPPPPAPAAGWRIRIVDAPGLPRAELRLGAPGPSRAAPDRIALEVAAEALNAAAGDRGPQMRVSALKDGGLVSLSLTVPVDSVGAAAQSLRATLARRASDPPAEAALAAARKRLAHGYPLAFETRGLRIAQWMGAAFAGLPAGALADYPARVEAVRPAEAAAAMAHWVPAGRLVLIAIGPAERLRAQLAPLGAVEIVLPEAAVEEALSSPSTDATPPTDAQRARGRELARKMIAAHGGLERLKGIKDSTLEGDVLMIAGAQQFPGRIVQVRKEPGRFLLSTELSILKTVQVLDGEHGWSQAGAIDPKIEDQDSLGLAGLKAGFRSDLHHLLLTAADSSARVAWRGRERVEEREADVLEVVAADGDRRVLFLDPASHLVLAMEQGEGGHSARRIYSDVRAVNGLQWPFHEERLLDGQPAMTLTLKRVVFNTGVSDQVFHRPGGATYGRRRPR